MEEKKKKKNQKIKKKIPYKKQNIYYLGSNYKKFFSTPHVIHFSWFSFSNRFLAFWKLTKAEKLMETAPKHQDFL